MASSPPIVASSPPIAASPINSSSVKNVASSPTSTTPEAPAVVTSGPPVSPMAAGLPQLVTSISNGGGIGNGSPTSSSGGTVPSLVMAIYQGGYLDGVERNLSLMRKFLGQCTTLTLSTPAASIVTGVDTTPSSSPTSSSGSSLAVPSSSPQSSPTHHRTPSRGHTRTPSRVPLDSPLLLIDATPAADTAKTDSRPDVVVFPELFLTGYVGGEDRVVGHAQYIDGPAFRLIASMAKEFKVAIVFGYPERSGTKVYNSVVFITRDGVQLCNYRKVHLYGAYEQKIFTAGDSLPPVVDYLGVKIALLICYDIEVTCLC
jgi:hypothetical protein